MQDILVHQIVALQGEIDFLKRRLAAIPAPLLFACNHARNFYWTVTRLAGRSDLHDASRFHATARAAFDVEIPEIFPSHTPRIFLDISSTYVSRYRAGVQRVMRELCRAAVEENLACPVIVENGVFVILPDKRSLDWRPGDALILLDSTWPETRAMAPAIAHAAAHGAHVVLGLHDTIPVDMPGYTTPAIAAAFRDWLTTVLPMSSAVMAVSRASAVDLARWAEAYAPDASAAAAGWFGLGADFRFEGLARPRSDPGHDDFGRPYFLTVGTLEPRKGHSIALDAFDRLWAQNVDCAYVIAGREGWNVEALKARIFGHPEFRRRLFFVEGPSDERLAKLYAGARALVLPTMAEGFGLPLIEAARYRVPAIVSDIPSFREIAGDEVVYFGPGDSEGLAECLRAAHSKPPLPPRIAAGSWRESAQRLFAMVAQRSYPSTLADLAAESRRDAKSAGRPMPGSAPLAERMRVLQDEIDALSMRLSAVPPVLSRMFAGDGV